MGVLSVGGGAFPVVVAAQVVAVLVGVREVVQTRRSGDRVPVAGAREQIPVERGVQGRRAQKERAATYQRN